jgi:uncharacterized protein with FMN-binding domain
MKKITVASLIIGAFLIFSFVQSRSNSAAITPKPSPDSVTASSTPAPRASVPRITGRGSDDSDEEISQGQATKPAAPTPTTTSPSPVTASGSQYRDGTYTGGEADAQWGFVQVKVVVSHGKITDVQFLDYPNDRSRSRYINSIADPELANEAIQAQSAQVDIITGATDSSEAFMQSLADALSQASA